MTDNEKEGVYQAIKEAVMGLGAIASGAVRPEDSRLFADMILKRMNELWWDNSVDGRSEV